MTISFNVKLVLDSFKIITLVNVIGPDKKRPTFFTISSLRTPESVFLTEAKKQNHFNTQARIKPLWLTPVSSGGLKGNILPSPNWPVGQRAGRREVYVERDPSSPWCLQMFP